MILQNGKQKKRSLYSGKTELLFKGNKPAKTCLINNRDLIALENIPHLEDCNKSTEQVLCYGE